LFTGHLLKKGLLTPGWTGFTWPPSCHSLSASPVSALSLPASCTGLSALRTVAGLSHSWLQPQRPAWGLTDPSGQLHNRVTKAHPHGSPWWYDHMSKGEFLGHQGKSHPCNALGVSLQRWWPSLFLATHSVGPLPGGPATSCISSARGQRKSFRSEPKLPGSCSWAQDVNTGWFQCN
jgi:hypothetical protein